MYLMLLVGLIGDEGFDRILIGLPDCFFGMQRAAQDEVWKAVLGQINDGERDPGKLIEFASEWIKLFQTINKVTI